MSKKELILVGTARGAERTISCQTTPTQSQKTEETKTPPILDDGLPPGIHPKKMFEPRNLKKNRTK